jgi:hypothetical protein
MITNAVIHLNRWHDCPAAVLIRSLQTGIGSVDVLWDILFVRSGIWLSAMPFSSNADDAAAHQNRAVVLSCFRRRRCTYCRQLLEITAVTGHQSASLVMWRRFLISVVYWLSHFGFFPFRRRRLLVAVGLTIFGRSYLLSLDE